MKKKSKALAEKKEKKLHHKITFWLSVLFLGTVVGTAVQFTRAWVEPDPSATPPGGNIAAPINTGPVKQTKVGTATSKADICVDAYGDGDEKCLSDLISFPACTLAGGVPTMVEGSVTLCKFPGSTCGAGWHKYPNDTLYYNETIAKTCTGGGSCGDSVTSGSHSFAKIDPASETKIYHDGNSTDICGPWGACINNCACWCKDYCCPCTCCCGWQWICTGSSCSSTEKYCNSTITYVGCVQ